MLLFIFIILMLSLSSKIYKSIESYKNCNYLHLANNKNSYYNTKGKFPPRLIHTFDKDVYTVVGVAVRNRNSQRH